MPASRRDLVRSQETNTSRRPGQMFSIEIPNDLSVESALAGGIESRLTWNTDCWAQLVNWGWRPRSPLSL